MLPNEKLVYEAGCCDGFGYYPSEVNGECPDCGMETIDGEAAYGCFYSPRTCETCGATPCDQSC